MWFGGSLGGASRAGLVNSGASHSFVSPQWLEKARQAGVQLEARECSPGYVIRLANDEALYGTIKHRGILEVGSFQAPLEMLEAPLFKYDIILGRIALSFFQTGIQTVVRTQIDSTSEGRRQ